MLEQLQRKLGLRTDPVIFFISAALTVAVGIQALALTTPVGETLAHARGRVVTNLNWLFIFGVTSFLIFLTWIALSRYGDVRLGGRDERPEYSNLAWFAMLFAAGIGTILMFWGVA
jgi:choline/glycine/proline betaine transport protein